MTSTGRRNPVEDEFDIDCEIQDIVKDTNEHIRCLLNDYSKEDYKKLARAIIEVHLDKIVEL